MSCKGECGFHGSDSTEGYCSQCYKAYLAAKEGGQPTDSEALKALRDKVFKEDEAKRAREHAEAVANAARMAAPLLFIRSGVKRVVREAIERVGELTTPASLWELLQADGETVYLSSEEAEALFRAYESREDRGWLVS